MPDGYSVLVHHRFTRSLIRIERCGRRDVVLRAQRAIAELRDDPYTPKSGLDTKCLHGEAVPTYRVRIGDYRLLYTVDDEKRVVYITAIFRRDGGY